MRAIIYKRGGYDLGVIGETGGETAGEVLLIGDPTVALEASTKNYVDNKLLSLSMSDFNVGTVDPLHVPAFSGSLLKGAGSSVLTISDSGVSPGTYTKVLVNNKGIIYDSSALAESDIPNLSWSKIASNTPTTLTGYNITDGLASTGGTMTGTLQIDTVIPDPEALANKDYVDGQGSSGLAITTGGIIYRTSNVTPTGYRRCNGSIISKTTYPALYASIGDKFGPMYPGVGRPWQQQYEFNTQQSAVISGWTTDTALPSAVSDSHFVVTLNRVYLLGGLNGSSVGVATVRTAPINADGTLGAWTTGTALPFTLYGGSIIVVNNRIHIFGGFATDSVSNKTINASIDSEGIIGAWTVGNDLPMNIYAGEAVLIKNRVYLLGGYGNLGETYSAEVNQDGTLGVWEKGTNLPESIYGMAAIVTKNKVFLAGGASSSDFTSVSTVYSADVEDGGYLSEWRQETNLPVTIAYSRAIVTYNRVYLLGGYTTAVSSAVYSAPINADGTLGTWASNTALPAAVSRQGVIVTSNKIYMLGGYTSAQITTVRSANFEGGFNEYATYYSGGMLTLDPSQFKLPTITPKLPGTYAYIKY